MPSESDLDRQIGMLMRCQYLKETEVRQLCERAREILVDEANVQQVSSPVTVCMAFLARFAFELVVFAGEGGLQREMRREQKRSRQREGIGVLVSWCAVSHPPEKALKWETQVFLWGAIGGRKHSHTNCKGFWGGGTWWPCVMCNALRETRN